MGLLTVTPPRARAVVITGASSGLGRAAAIRLSGTQYLGLRGRAFRIERRLTHRAAIVPG